LIRVMDEDGKEIFSATLPATPPSNNASDSC
jgi:hypothetical protein